MKRKGSFLWSLVSILLVIAAVVGMVVMVDKIGDEFEKAEENQSDIADKTPSGDKMPSGDSGSNSGSDSDNNGSSGDGEQIDPELNYYINQTTNTGYVVQGDKTIFFKRIYPEMINNSAGVKVESSCIKIGPNYMKQYSSYSLYLAKSSDFVLWEDVVFIPEYGEDWPDWIFFSDSGYLCVSYTSITNCNTPNLVLEDLNQNVFFNEEYFRVVHDTAAG